MLDTDKAATKTTTWVLHKAFTCHSKHHLETEVNKKSLVPVSQIYTEKDIIGNRIIGNRIILANIAFNKFKNLWMKCNIISIKHRIQVYTAQVLSILLVIQLQ